MRIHRILWTRHWWQKLKYPRVKGVPLTEKGETQESGYPWRIGSCRVYRLPFSRHAVAIGHWWGQQSVDADEDGNEVLRLRALDNWRDYAVSEEERGR